MKEKKLFIIRHAKAEEHSFSKQDFHRNIIDKGIKRATKLARELKNNIQLDDGIMCLSSSANRALQTAYIYVDILGLSKDQIIQTAHIYEAHYNDILKEFNKVPHHINTLFVFGHNPGLSDLCNYLCNSNIILTTSAIAEIAVEERLHFDELSGNTATLRKIYSE